MNTTKLFEQLTSGKHLCASDMQEIMLACMKGELSDVQIAVFLALMRMKGETVDELTTAATIMKELAHSIDLGPDLIDIVGTGGDGKNTFNVSTASSIVAAASGAKVAKHGNRSVSGKSGSSDLLMEAGFELHLSDEELKACMDTYQICFLFAPHFHPAMLHARNARQQLAIRSFFNLLGPLINPAKVKKQVVGVFDKRWQQPIAQVLANLGSNRAMVITSEDGMDEVSIAAKTTVVEFHHEKFLSWTIDPKDYGCYHKTLDDIIVCSPKESLTLIESVLDGKLGPARDIVLLNTAIALYCANIASDYAEGIKKARESIDSGEAKNRFMKLKAFTQGIL